MGGMFFGGVTQERIQFNEISLWTSDENETGGYQAFGDLYIKFAVKDSIATGYQRELDISRSVMKVKCRTKARFTVLKPRRELPRPLQPVSKTVVD
ncbi:glycoside hydrolase family 95 protein [Mucilaginibacter sp. RB4R14]|uniref:glycoside hydrolase N-terminal domain-containing protein n=1 Tax=Mucilaginibacter aurantiaciroseus TaxID=2949308 RepID=UPI0020903EC5|nr:glycoside hydrolase N-terminal domain-containing protein [Mucilaginibacter aurantiaciroseus]MCO5934701.1 glycoside hydrolase family 95 protein [Mucilaginibacter aurantiaciroseus]